MIENRVLHGSIALIKVGDTVIGKMRSISATENYNRLDVQGMGTIYTQEAPVVKFTGNVQCSFMSMSFAHVNDGIKGAIRRDLPNLASRVFDGEISLEDQLSIDSDRGVQIDVFKKVEDILNPDGTIRPKAIPYAIIRKCLIESDSFEVSEGAVAGHNQSFRFLEPIQYVSPE